MNYIVSLASNVKDALSAIRGHSMVQGQSWYREYYGLLTNGYSSTWSEFLSDSDVTAPEVKEAIKRLALEYIKLPPGRYLWAVFTAADIEGGPMGLLNGVKFVSDPGDPADGVYFQKLVRQTPYMAETEVIPWLSSVYPFLNFSNFRNERYGNYVVDWEFKEELVPQEHRRFLQDAPNIRGYAVEVAYRDSGYTFDHLTEDGEGIASTHINSVLYQPHTSYLGNLSEEIMLSRVEQGRAHYRDRVMRRLRNTDPDGVQAALERQRAAHAAKTAQNFVNFRAKKERDSFGQMVIPTLPVVEPGTRASRRWGIEIETGAGRDLRGTPPQWDSKDDGSLESAYDDMGYVWIDPSECEEYNHRTEDVIHEITMRNPESGEEHYVEIANTDEYRDPRNCGYCGWVEPSYGYDSDDCVELVSPILTSFHSRGLRQICEDLEFAPRTESAGIHVHVEAKDLTVQQIRELVLGYDHIEHLIEPSYDRQERGYCKRRAATELLNIARQARSVEDVSSLRKGDRYVTVNLISLDYHGTVEFRAMGPRYNYDHLIRWAMFCREMVNVVKNGAKSKDFAKVKTWEDVTAIFAKYGIEYNMAAGVSEPATLSADEDQLVSV